MILSVLITILLANLQYHQVEGYISNIIFISFKWKRKSALVRIKSMKMTFKNLIRIEII